MSKLISGRRSYSVNEVSDMTGFSAESIRKGCAAKRYPHVLHGRYYFMTDTHIEAMLASETREVNPAAISPQAAEEAEMREALQFRRKSNYRRTAA